MSQIVGESRNAYMEKSLMNNSYLRCNNVFIMLRMSLPNERNKRVVIPNNYADYRFKFVGFFLTMYIVGLVIHLV